jgi:hypothetical protein
MPKTELTFDSPDRLKEILDTVVSEYAARIMSIRITKGLVTIEFDKDIELMGFGSDDLWEQLRNAYLMTYEYAGTYSVAVMQEIFRVIKSEGLSPIYFVINPNSILKRTIEWRDLSVSSVAETKYFGLRVVETEAIDEDGFVIAAGHSPNAQVHNVVMGVKGQINAFV